MSYKRHPSPPEAFRLAVDSAASMSDLARRIGTSQQRISYRLRRGYDCPIDLAPAIERETGISKHLLRPDFFGDTPTAPIPVPVADPIAQCDRPTIPHRKGDA